MQHIWLILLSYNGVVFLSEVQKTKKSLAIYLIILWMAINTFLMIPEIGVFNDYTYVIELILWIASSIGLWFMKKWGAALTIAILCISLGTSMSTVFVAHYLSSLLHWLALLNFFRAIINAISSVYMFKNVFAMKFG
jgi:hypothetical protein